MFSQFLSFCNDFSLPTQMFNWLSSKYTSKTIIILIIRFYYIDDLLLNILFYTSYIFEPLIFISLTHFNLRVYHRMTRKLLWY